MSRFKLKTPLTDAVAPDRRPATGDNKTHIFRIMRDIREFYAENPSSMHIVADEKDQTTVHALIRGPEKTPYENGFFYFVFTFPHTYPLHPPLVKFMTTDGHKVRFNPNLYSCGKVCLSILGTWAGPAWSPVQTLFSTMLSIQSLLCERPIFNEPGYERHSKDPTFAKRSDAYNERIAFETIRVAVIGMLGEGGDSQNMPEELKDVMIAYFKNNYQYYEDLVRRKMAEEESKPKSAARTFPYPLEYFDPSSYSRRYQYKDLLKKLLELKGRFEISTEPKTDSCADSAQDSTESLGSAVEDTAAESYKKVADHVLSTYPVPSPSKPEEEVFDWNELLNNSDEESFLEPYEEDGEEEGDSQTDDKQ